MCQSRSPPRSHHCPRKWDECVPSRVTQADLLDLVSSVSHGQRADLSYVLDRMMSMTLGRPPGISDDDIDVSLPNVQVEPVTLPVQEMCIQSMVSAIHYFKLKRLESQIQRTYYTIAGRNRLQAAGSSWPLLGLLEQWESDIPVEAANPARDQLPCCSKDWFQLRVIEARLHLLRPMCSGTGQTSDEYLALLAKNAALGCELQCVPMLTQAETAERRPINSVSQLREPRSIPPSYVVSPCYMPCFEIPPSYHSVKSLSQSKPHQRPCLRTPSPTHRQLLSTTYSKSSQAHAWIRSVGIDQKRRPRYPPSRRIGRQRQRRRPVVLVGVL